jgi:hypothetical protein
MSINRTDPHGPNVRKIAVNYHREIFFIRCLLFLTCVIWLVVSWETGKVLWQRLPNRQVGAIIEQVVFIFIVQGLVYGNFVYLLTRLGYLHRRL